MSDDRGSKFSWVWVFIAIGVVRMMGSTCSGPTTPARSKPRASAVPQTLKVPAVPSPAGLRTPGAAAEKPDDWVVLTRFPARRASPATGAPGEPPDMNALVERAREKVGKAGTLVPRLAPPTLPRKP